MSEKSWLKEFYPVAASSRQATRTDVAACEHSLRKWLGARKTALKKHGVEKPPMWFGDKTCALCRKHLRLRYGDASISGGCLFLPTGCETCPLAIVRGGVSCDSSRPNERTPPFGAYAGGSGSPALMISWLRKALKYAQAEEAKKKAKRSK